MGKIYILLSVFIVNVTMLLTPINITINDIEKDNPRQKYYDLVEAISIVESEGDSTAYCKSERAAGLLQIRPIMVREVNRIEGKQRFKLSDRWNVNKSIEMFFIYSEYYSNVYNETRYIYENISRRWNGGPNGHKKKSTISYWKKVKELL